MLSERVLHYYTGQGYNCAEAMLRGIRDTYGLPIAEESLNLVSAFGGGMGCGRLCGAVAGAVAALGAMLVEDQAHQTPGFGDRCAALVERMVKELGSDQCSDLKPRHYQEDLRCQQVVKQAAQAFEAYAREAELTDRP